MTRTPAVALACLCVSLMGCASHHHDDAQNVCQQDPVTGRSRHGVHGTFMSSVGKTLGGAMPMALNAVPGVGGMAGGLAGMGMQQAMGGFSGGPGSMPQDDGFHQSGFDHRKPPTEDEEEAAQSQRKIRSVPCKPEEDHTPDLRADDIRMEEAH